MYCYYNDQADNGEAGKAIFDPCKTVLPPIATLVLGYDFGQPPGSHPEGDRRALDPRSE